MPKGHYQIMSSNTKYLEKKKLSHFLGWELNWSSHQRKIMEFHKIVKNVSAV